MVTTKYNPLEILIVLLALVGLVITPIHEQETISNVKTHNTKTMELEQDTLNLDNQKETATTNQVEFNEDFTSTTYRDPITNVEGWGTGSVRSPKKSFSLAGTIDSPGSAVGVYVEGNYAYIADEIGGVRIIDISDPTTPTFAAVYDEWNSEGYDVHVTGDNAYIAGGTFYILDISDPTSPERIVSVAGTFNQGYDLDVAGNYAYVANGTYGLRVFDISDPSAPFLADSFSTSYSSQGVYVYGDYAYVAVGSNGLQVIDISDPTTVSGVDIINTDYARDVFIAGNYAYVADAGSGLRVIDISDPSNPTLAGSYNTPGYAYEVYVEGDYAYVADGSSGLQVIDISDPTTPSLIDSFGTSDSSQGVYVEGNYAYLADGSNGLQVIEISDPVTPDIIDFASTNHYARDVHVAGDYAYVADGERGLNVVDISDPLNPTSVGNYDTPNTSWGVYVYGDYAYLADRHSGLQVIDISDPTTPTFAGSYNTPGRATGVYVDGDYAYVADYDRGLRVVDISDPTNPTSAGVYDGSGYAQKVFIAGDYAYVANRLDFQVIDISDPTKPTLAGIYDSTVPYFDNDVYVAGDYAYVAEEQGFTVLDISNPATPIYAGGIDTTGGANALYVAGDYAYIADWSNGFLAIDISDPTSPTLSGEVSYFTVNCVFIAGDYAYVGTTSSQLHVIEIARHRTRQYESLSYAQSTKVYTISDSSTITRLTLSSSYSTPTETFIAFAITLNGGTDWNQVNPGEEYVFETSGNDLRWKADLSCSDSYSLVTAQMYSVTITHEHYPEPTITSNFANNSIHNSNTEIVLSISDSSLLNEIHFNWDNTGDQILSAPLNSSFSENLPLTEGEHTLNIKVEDIVGNFINKKYIFTVDDTKPDIVSHSGLSENAVISGEQEIIVTATDNVEIDRVVFLVEGTQEHVALSPPYQWQWDTLDESNGNYTVTIRVIDKAGNEVEKSFDVTVKNMQEPTTTNGGLPTEPKSIEIPTQPPEALGIVLILAFMVIGGAIIIFRLASKR
ncbi:MAG: Ig-like domain-containing protein [Candidatus Hodarchaeota archaeon]